MADTTDQALSPSNAPGAFPLTAFPGPSIPADYRAVAPDRDDGAELMGLCVVHPPMAALMGAFPQETLSSMILPALELATESGLNPLVERDTKYAIEGFTTEDGLYLLFIYQLPG